MNQRDIIYGWRGEGKPQAAINLRRRMTPQEVLLWQRLRAHRFDGLHFRRQVTIDGFIADFYCHTVGLVVEVDGGVHLATQAYDALRDRIISARGLHVIRVTNTQVETDMPAVLSAIRAGVEYQHARIAAMPRTED